MLFFAGAYRAIYYYHGDHLGSSNYITDRTGRVFEHTIYLPYGETWIDEGHETSLLGYKFTGKELDEETGLYYFGARYYDAKFSNWISTDPALKDYLPRPDEVYFPEQVFNASKLKGSGGVYKSFNLNMYHYSSMNPVRFVDPDGKSSKDFYNGLNAGVGDAMTLGVMHGEFYNQNLASAGNQEDFLKGYILGSIIQEVGGAGEIVAGLLMMGGSGALEIASVGVATPVALAGVTAGVSTSTHGAASASTAMNNRREAQAELNKFASNKKTGPGGEKHAGGSSQVNSVANQLKMTKEQRREFGKHIEDVKKSEGRGGADNFSYKELMELGKEFLEGK